MGTSALTRITDESGMVLVNIYTQSDGYLDGYGKEIAKFLEGRKLVNGIPLNNRNDNKISNGMGCLAASFISIIKERVGRHYLVPLSVNDLDYDFIYLIDPNNITVQIGIWIYEEDVPKLKTLFNGSWSNYCSEGVNINWNE